LFCVQGLVSEDFLVRMCARTCPHLLLYKNSICKYIITWPQFKIYCRLIPCRAANIFPYGMKFWWISRENGLHRWLIDFVLLLKSLNKLAYFALFRVWNFARQGRDCSSSILVEHSIFESEFCNFYSSFWPPFIPFLSRNFALCRPPFCCFWVRFITRLLRCFPSVLCGRLALIFGGFLAAFTGKNIAPKLNVKKTLRRWKICLWGCMYK